MSLELILILNFAYSVSDVTTSEQEEKPAWLIRVNTVSEAHRLVRRYHMTLLDSDKALIQARIIY